MIFFTKKLSPETKKKRKKESLQYQLIVVQMQVWTSQHSRRIRGRIYTNRHIKMYYSPAALQSQVQELCKATLEELSALLNLMSKHKEMSKYSKISAGYQIQSVKVFSKSESFKIELVMNLCKILGSIKENHFFKSMRKTGNLIKLLKR